MKIGILETGLVNENLSDKFEPYPAMFEYLLKRSEKGFEYASYSVIGGELPQSIDECDGWLITGSRHGVYEGLDWMLRLQGFIREVHDADIPLVGICFGHQIIAQALGGQVEKSDRGWSVGVQQYDIRERKSWMEKNDNEDTVNIYAYHQDQVVEKPPGATVLLESDFCPYAGLVYGDSAISIQAHPEFEAAYEFALLDLFGGSIVPEDRADKAKAKMSDGNVAETDRLSKWITQFFRQYNESRQQAASA